MIKAIVATGAATVAATGLALAPAASSATSAASTFNALLPNDRDKGGVSAQVGVLVGGEAATATFQARSHNGFEYVYVANNTTRTATLTVWRTRNGTWGSGSESVAPNTFKRFAAKLPEGRRIDIQIKVGSVAAKQKKARA